MKNSFESRVLTSIPSPRKLTKLTSENLYRYATDSRYEYRNQWRAVDTMIWDNQVVNY